MDDNQRAEERATLSLQETQLRLAAEQNLLAWVRTGLSIIGLGFVVAKFGLFLRELAQVTKADDRHLHAATSSWIGSALVALGGVTCVLAGIMHLRLLAQLRCGGPYPAPRWPQAVSVSFALATLGLAILLYLTSVAR